MHAAPTRRSPGARAGAPPALILQAPRLRSPHRPSPQLQEAGRPGHHRTREESEDLALGLTASERQSGSQTEPRWAAEPRWGDGETVGGALQMHTVCVTGETGAGSLQCEKALLYRVSR